jgi:hypothetical protein
VTGRVKEVTHRDQGSAADATGTRAADATGTRADATGTHAADATRTDAT